MCFKNITDWIFKKKYGITPPVDTEDIGMFGVYNYLTAEFPKAKLYLSDWIYKVAPFSEYERLIQWSNVDKRKYVTDMYDCDDFSFALMGDFHMPEWSALAFGILWLKEPAHAVNVFIDNGRNVWIVESQTDSIFHKPNHWIEEMVIM